MDIISATQQNDCRSIQILLHRGVDPNIQQPNGKSALHIAILKHNLPAVQLLLRGKANPLIADNHGNNALHLAVADKKNSQILHELLGSGIDVNIVNKSGLSALQLASRYGHHDFICLLIKHNANVNQQSNNGLTAIMIAAMNSHEEVVSELLKNGANVYIQDHNRKNALHFSIIGGNRAIYNQIERIILSNSTENLDYSSSILNCAQKGHADILEKLIEHMPCDLNHINEMRQSALHIAVQEKHKKTVKVLLRKGITIDRRDHGILGANTSLIYAAKENKCAILKQLLAAGADFELTNVEQKTATYFAAERGHIEATAILLAYFKERAWEYRTLSGKEVCYLQSPLNVIMHSPLEAAVINNHFKIVQMLLKSGLVRKLKYALLYAARKGCHRVFRIILKYVVSANVTESVQSHFPSLQDWKRAMSIAVTNGHLEIVKMFLQKGASEIFGYDFVKSSILQSKTALHLAAGGGCTKVVKLLLRNGAEPDAIDELGYSPFLYAVEMNRTKVAVHFLTGKCRNQILLDVIDIYRKNNAALHLAAQNGNAELLDHLITVGCSPEYPAMWPTTAGYPASIEHHLSTVYPVILTVMKRNFPATLTLLNHSCMLHVSSIVDMTPLTALQCTIKFDDPVMFKCLFLSGNLMYIDMLRQIQDLVAQNKQLPKQTHTWLKQSMGQPKMLQDWARISIRQSINGRKVTKVNSLFLPTRLQNYLLLKEFEGGLMLEDAYKTNLFS